MGSRLEQLYKKEIIPALIQEFNLSNIMEAPRLEKIVINMGLGDAIENVKLVEAAKSELGAITGQQPVVARAKRSIASFKLRAGMPIGVMVTLRKDRMYEFIDRLVHIALPRVRDFRGINAKLDGKGNYTLGIREQIIFPEINYDKIEKVKGMNATFVTTAPNDEQGRALLSKLGLPFRKG
jgi:large subunit ribosomal protein L5